MKNHDCTFNGKAFVLWGYYDITIERINTYPKLVEWIYHLSGKRDFTMEMLAQLLVLVSKHTGLQLAGHE